MSKLVFFGTPEYVIPILDALAKYHEILAVVTQPPKPVGRKQTLTPSPVAKFAQTGKIRVLTDLKTLPSADVGILAAYGKLVPKETIEHFPHGIINIHPSLLPKYRGASPIQAAISTGEKETGVTIIKLDEEMDHGPILAQFTERLMPDDTTGSLRDRLFKKAAETLLTILPDYLEGKLKVQEQEHTTATYTKIIKKEHGFIPGKFISAALQGVALQKEWPIPFIRDYSLIPSPYSLERFVRSLNPWPGAYTNVKLKMKSEKLEKRLKILEAHVEDRPIVRLVLDQVQLEGKNPVSRQQFVQGYPRFQFV